MQHSFGNQRTETDVARISRIAFFATFAIVVAVVLTKAAVISPEMDALFAKFGPDHVLRLVMVRDWLAGQSWFDTTAYRMMPPEGVLIHWSRYIDAMIGGLIWVLSSFMHTAKAEMLAVVIWPTFLQIAVIAAIGFGTKRLFGPVEACFAMLCAFVWPFTAQFYFRPGHIDHHNVQILMIIVMTLAAVWPERPLRSGLVAGIAAGFALAIGLETLPYILLLGLLLFMRATLGVSPVANRLLVAFSTALLLSAVLFWLGQTPAARLSYPVCDQIGPPVLSLIMIATAASLVPIVFGLRKVALRFAVSILVVGVGCLLAWPLLSVCIAGPYGSLPIEVQEIIRSSIVEAAPGVQFAMRNPLLYIEMLLPVAATILIAGVIWWGMRKQKDADPKTRDIVGQLLILSTVGIIASFSQVRLTLMTAGAVPLLAGFALGSLVSLYVATRSSDTAVKLLMAALVVLAPTAFTNVLGPLLPEKVQKSRPLDNACREKEAMTALNALPPAVFLTTTNLSSLMLFATDHSVLSGPYHRSPDAFANGKLPFGLPDAEMQAYVERIGAEYIMLCEGSDYGEGLATSLAKGGSAAWLRPVELESAPILVFEVLHEDGA